MLAAPSAPARAAARVADHVIVVIMENHSSTQVRTAPYTASLIAQSTSFSQSYGLTHPSQPNYMMLWSAASQGVTSDACPPPGSPYASENLGHACEAAGLTWKAYSENLPAAASTACTASGTLYTRKHDPWVSFSNLTHANEVPFTQLATDIAGGALPDLAFVVPNNCDNTHDCPVATGDNWLASHLPAMISAVGANGIVILTWDEDDYASGNSILTVFAGPLVKTNYVSSQVVTHYSMVRTICDLLGLVPFASAANEAPIVDVWAPGSNDVPPGAASRVTLGPAQPNPFRGRVSATLRLPTEGHVEAAIYDAAGRRVRRLFAGPRSGVVEIAWDSSRDDGRAAGPGLYFLRVRVGGAALEARLIRIE
jgi:hypothetical protein